VYRLRAIAGELGPSRIGFSEGQVIPAAEPKVPAPPKDEGPVAMGAALAAAVDGIPDPELRAAFAAAAERYLARVGPSRRTKETSDA
jgi:peptidoglycan hydrolase-like protein with peptidoglycan-binding domain